MVLGICLITLRLTFGGTPNPKFGIEEISETVSDLKNALPQCRGE